MDGAQIYIILLICIYILYIFRNYIKRCKFILKLDGPPALPIIGNVKLILDENLMDILRNEIFNYGPLIRIWVNIMPYVAILEPDDIQKVIGSSKNLAKPIFYKLLDTLIGNGLITRDIESWKIHRKIIQPAFHVQMLEKFALSFTDCGEHLVDKFSKKCNESINITPLINDAIHDLLMEIILGRTPDWKKDNQSNDIKEKLFRKCQVLALHRLIRPWLLIDWIYRLTETGKTHAKDGETYLEACRIALKKKRKNITDLSAELPDDGRISLLEYLIGMQRKNPDFTDEDIVSECCTFMLAGQDTVSGTIAMTLMLLANNPEWQLKCVNELYEVFGDGPISMTMNTNRKLKCLEMCIKETLRLYPAVPLIARILSEDVKVENHVIPSGCGVFISPFCTHRLPHLFPDPEMFKPERFNPDNLEEMHPYAYFPFSGGPRNCIGYKFAMLEIKAIVGAILMKYHLEPVDGKNVIVPKYRISIRARGGLWVKVTLRGNFHSTFQHSNCKQ